jgi:nitroimidazol reductase NimA-like FMN-containing flavoprotein (pyridoxamine 5'-phosphate oxidase superfamily)
MDRTDKPRRLDELPRDESLRLLAGVPMGRIVFTVRALPAVRPVNHLVDGEDIIVRTHLGASVVSAATGGVVVAYEADSIDPVDRLGWSVVVTGVAELVQDPDEADRYRQLLRPWVNKAMDQVIRIRPEIVTGFVLVEEDAIAA